MLAFGEAAEVRCVACSAPLMYRLATPSTRQEKISCVMMWVSPDPTV